MKNRIVTISREFGSGGRTIGKKVAEKLGMACYDAGLIQKMAEKSGFTGSYIKEAGEDMWQRLFGTWCIDGGLLALGR